MPRKREIPNLTSPKAVALELAGLALVAWGLKVKKTRGGSELGRSTPLDEDIDGDIVFVHAANEGPFTVGVNDKTEGYVVVHALRNPDGSIKLDESGSNETDIRRLLILKGHISKLLESWRERAQS
ncbi:MAG: hypothetical protein AAB896_00610 [Patescibacteria group bacterium]